MKKKSNNIKIIILAFILVISGLIILLYPIISNFLAMRKQAEAIKQYDGEISSFTNSERIEKEFENANIYNDNLAGNSLQDPFVKGSGYALPSNYLNILNIDGIIGYLEIPKISLKLPIYHGTTQEVLEKGVGHIESTAFPIGEKSCHSVLTGHRGLPNAKLFTDLDKLVIGNYFYITVLNKTMAYEVYNIETIEPTELEKIQTIKNKDLVTLVTCTPYGINTHRLLIYGERAEKDNNSEEIENNNYIKNLEIEKNRIYVIIIIVAIILLVLIMNIIKKRRGKFEK